MQLALAILFLWLGCALLWVAFSGLSKDNLKSEHLSGKPSDVATVLQDKVASRTSAYNA